MQHIRKYRAQRSRLVRETPEVYKDVVLPYINTLPSKSINWSVQSEYVLLDVR